jgi:hypothetical protein
MEPSSNTANRVRVLKQSIVCSIRARVLKQSIVCSIRARRISMPMPRPSKPFSACNERHSSSKILILHRQLHRRASPHITGSRPIPCDMSISPATTTYLRHIVSRMSCFLAAPHPKDAVVTSNAHEEETSLKIHLWRAVGQYCHLLACCEVKRRFHYYYCRAAVVKQI